MRIFVILAISLSFGLPALAQTALWGTSNSNSSGQNSSSGQNPTGQGQPNPTSVGPGYGPSGPGTRGANPNSITNRPKKNKTQQSLMRADARRAKMNGASAVKSYDDNSTAKPSGQSASNGNASGSAQQAPTNTAPLPAQAAPAAPKRNGVQTY